MPGTARKVVITERQQEFLRKLVRSSTCSQGVARRAKVILLAFEGFNNEEIAAKVGLGRHQGVFGDCGGSESGSSWRSSSVARARQISTRQ